MKPGLENLMQTLAGGGGLLASTGWKSLAVLALAMAVAGLWRRGTAAARHLMWAATFACLLSLPLFKQFVPVWHAPAWMVPAASINHVPEFILSGTQNTGPAVEKPAPVNPGAGNSTVSMGGNPVSSVATKSMTVEWGGVVVTIWLAGVALGILRRLAVQVWLHGFSRGMQVCNDPAWRWRLDDLRAEYQLKRPVKLLISDAFVTPVTWGWWRPVVVLPGESRQWPEARLDLVLRHELAHVKRWDCLTQELAQAVCVLYWFNPLVWLAARWMRAEREKACDDFVLNTGAPPVEYAGHLVEIARQFIGAPYLSGMVAMARPSGLEQRVTAILDGRRNRKRTASLQVVAIITVIFGVGWLIGGCAAESPGQPWSLKNSKLSGQLKHFIAEKEAQEKILIAADEQNPQLTQEGGLKFTRADCGPFFAAAKQGDWLAVSNLWSGLEARIESRGKDRYVYGSWRIPLMETYSALEACAVGNEKYSMAYGHDIIRSMPRGSIYFGGTDPGRFIITAMSQSQVSGNPIFTLTQNALAEYTYFGYLRSMYGGELALPGEADVQKAFQDYVADASIRMREGRLKPGEQVQDDGNGRIQVGGLVAVMGINALIAKDIFEQNSNREFYIEESWPLDWMYPLLEPHGLIMKINRQPLKALSIAVVQQDHDYWVKYITPMIGDWLDYDTPVAQVTAFADKVFGRHDLSGFHGDPDFVENEYSAKSFCKLRSSLADLYVWRMNQATNDSEKERMAREADFAYRQALALYPYSPEVTKEYMDFLTGQGRYADASLVAMLAKTPVFQVRLVHDQPSSNTEVMDLPVEKMATGETIRPDRLNVEKTILLDEHAVESALLVTQAPGEMEIDITLTADGRTRFAAVTREDIDRRLALVVDGKAWLAPTIKSEIEDGKLMITGHFNQREATDLAAAINTAAGK